MYMRKGADSHPLVISMSQNMDSSLNFVLMQMSPNEPWDQLSLVEDACCPEMNLNPLDGTRDKVSNVENSLNQFPLDSMPQDKIPNFVPQDETPVVENILILFSVLILPRDEDSLVLKISPPIVLHQDKISSNDITIILTSALPRDKHCLDDQNLDDDSLMELDPPKATTHINKTSSTRFFLPFHLWTQLPTMETPEGYKWVVLHGDWLLILKEISDKLISSEPTSSTPQEDPLDEELVDWGEDEDQDILAEGFEDEEICL